MGEIIGIPPSEFNYEFMAVKKLNNGKYQWLENYENYPYEIEGKDGVIIVHDLRVSHKERKKEN